VPSSTYIPYDDGKAAATYCCRNIQGCLRIIGTSKVALSEVLLMQYVNFLGRSCQNIYRTKQNEIQ